MMQGIEKRVHQKMGCNGVGIAYVTTADSRMKILKLTKYTKILTGLTLIYRNVI